MALQVAGSICNEVAKLLQAKIGGSYQTDLLFPLLNEEYEYIQNYHDWHGLLRADIASVIVNQTIFTLPLKYKKLVGTYYGSSQQAPGLYLFDSIDSAENALISILRGRSAEWLPETACALYTAFFGESCCIVQPTTPSETTVTAVQVKVLSDSVSDTSKKVLLQGEDANGNNVSEVVTTNGSNGTTAVTSSKSYCRFNNVSKESATAGNVSVVSMDLATTYAVIPATERRSYYAQYQMAQKVTTAGPVYFVGKLRFQPFRDKIEAPFMDGIAAALKFGTCARSMVEKRQNDYAKDYYSMRDAELTRVLSERNEPPDQRIVRC